MKYLIIFALALPLMTACVHHHHRDGPGNSENAPGHNKHKHGNGPGNSENAPGHNKDK